VVACVHNRAQTHSALLQSCGKEHGHSKCSPITAVAIYFNISWNWQN